MNVHVHVFVCLDHNSATWDVGRERERERERERDLLDNI